MLVLSSMKTCSVYEMFACQYCKCLVCKMLELNLRRGQLIHFFKSLEEICIFEKTFLSKKVQYFVKAHSPENQSQLAGLYFCMCMCHLQKISELALCFCCISSSNLFLVVSVYVTLLITLPHAGCFVREPDCLGFFHSLLH